MCDIKHLEKMPSEKVFQQATTIAKEENYKVYKRRWIMLAIFATCAAACSYHWILYSSISNIICNYYGITNFAVNWFAICYNITHIIMVFPATFFLNKMGLKATLLVGIGGTTVASWIKVLSVSRERFAVAMFGQVMAAASQIFILQSPPRLAALWFGPGQISTACSIGVFGSQVGIALSFLLTPTVVQESSNVDDVEHYLYCLFYTLSAISTALTLIVALVFETAPKLPPSSARAAAQSSDQTTSYMQFIKGLVTNRGYIMLFGTYGIIVGVSNTVSTLLNQIILHHFPGRQEDSGRMGLCTIASGLVGSALLGVWLDKTHRFKSTLLGVYILALLGMLAYSLSLLTGYISTVYLTVSILGFFLSGYMPLAFEFAAELTYPIPEGISSGFLNISAQFLGLFITNGDGWLLDSAGDLPANLALVGLLLVGSILTAFIKADLRRQAAHKGSAATPPDDSYCHI